MDLNKLKQSVKKSENVKLKVYLCPKQKHTIGWGRNLDDRGITMIEADTMLERDLLDIKLELEDKIKFFHNLDDIRQNVLIEMAYNMGVSHLLEFKNTLKFMEKSDFINASEEMLNSKWHRDFLEYDLMDGKSHNNGLLRSEYLSKIMCDGVY
ncbi:MAG: glycoside hydrolase family protein [Aliarcobacter sp.]|nr:glycoside hydrolase family protein [Aliarcobacter sp.]